MKKIYFMISLKQMKYTFLIFIFFMSSSSYSENLSSIDTTIIYKQDGSKQCTKNTKNFLTTLKKELKSKDVIVFHGCKARLGFVITMCKAPTSSHVFYQIRSKDVKKSQKLGFEIFKDKKVPCNLNPSRTKGL